jgi:hypothetical protein
MRADMSPAGERYDSPANVAQHSRMSIPFFSQLEKWQLHRDDKQNAAGTSAANLHQNLNLDEGQESDFSK